MSNQPLVSVITPVYNQERFIGETIRSILSQTYQDWEMIVVDDCSTDNSWDIIRSFAQGDKRIRIFRNKENKGLIKNWEFLIKQSKGDLIAFLEGDDVFSKDNLAERISVFSHYPDIGMVYSTFQVINDYGEILIKDIYSKLKIKTYRNANIEPTEYLYAKSLLFSTYSQIMIRKSVLSLSGYPRSFDPAEKVFLPSDWDFNFRISTKNKIYFVNKVLLKYRRHQANNSQNTLKVSKQLQMILDDYNKEFSSNKKILEAIKYMRGKICGFNIIYHIENDMKRDGWYEFFNYVKMYPKNLTRDFKKNITVLIRLLLPNSLNRVIRNIYFSDR